MYFQVDVSFKTKRSLIVEAKDYAEAEKVVRESVVEGVEGFSVDHITELTREEAMGIVSEIQTDEEHTGRTLN